MQHIELVAAICTLLGAIIGLISAIIGRRKVIEIKHIYQSEDRIESGRKWYDRHIWIFVWLLLFFPVGYYGLFRSRTITTGWKIGIPVVHVFLISALSK